MKKPLSLAASLAAVCLVGTFFGCSKEPETYGSNPNIDVPAQIQGLKSADVKDRTDAAVALSEAGPHAAEAVPALIDTLKDKDPLVRRLAAYALMEIGEEHAKQAVPAVAALLKDSDRDVRFQAVNTLKVLDPDNADGMQIRNVQ